MNLLLLADQAVGTDICSWLIERYPEDLGLVVTTERNDLADVAAKAGIRVESFSNSSDLADLIISEGMEFDLGVMAWWPKIIHVPLISTPRLGFINTHPSLLPFGRGKHYNFWTLVEQSPFGVTLHMVDNGVDTGPIVSQVPIIYDWEDNGGTLYDAAKVAIVDLFKQDYPRLRELKFSPRPQSPSDGSFHRAKEIKTASRIDLDAAYRARDLLNLLRARTFSGMPACWFEDDGVTYEVRVEIKRNDNESV